MFSKYILALIFCFLLTGCQQQVLYMDLTEQEANEIIALLYQSNLSASKIGEKGGKFRVDTSQSSFAQAVSILQQHGLPRERFDSIGEVFAKDGFVSSPLEERARLNYALSQEISRTISNIDGVLVARVHLAVPKRGYLSDSTTPSSASVFVKHRTDIDLGPSVGKIKSLVVTGFENLPYENVTVSLFPAEAVLKKSINALEIKKASMILPNSSSLYRYLIGFLALALLVASIILAKRKYL